MGLGQEGLSNSPELGWAAPFALCSNWLTLVLFCVHSALVSSDQKGTLEAQLAELSHHLGRLKYLGASAAFFSAVALPHHHIGDPNSPIQYARWVCAPHTSDMDRGLETWNTCSSSKCYMPLWPRSRSARSARNNPSSTSVQMWGAFGQPKSRSLAVVTNREGAHRVQPSAMSCPGCKRASCVAWTVLTPQVRST
eukprot:scaffold225516_cov18-Tisochrysis_lutea.AAC.1